ncbi:MAG: o-succinylbenzoate synthase [Propionibacteriaceae bacterium]
MKIEAIDLRRVSMPLVTPFRTSQSSESERNLLILQVHTDVGSGWSECSADDLPVYWSEYLDGAIDVLTKVLAPALLRAGEITPARVAEVLAPFKGHRTAKSALEAAVLDAWCGAAGISLADHLGAVRQSVPVGVSVAIEDSLGAMLARVDDYLATGYSRIKLKIEPGRDIEVVRAVREHVGDDVVLQVDANGAYTLADSRHLARLDAFDLALIEQPLQYDDLRAHATLAGLVRTPICLDESIVSARSAADAIALGACQVINIKPSRVGGYLESRRIHDVCTAHGVPVWCGGMLESGLGRAANLALAGLPGFTEPSDISATARYFHTDITEHFEMHDGMIDLPQGPGIGVTPRLDVLDEVTTWRTTVRPDAG